MSTLQIMLSFFHCSSQCSMAYTRPILILDESATSTLTTVTLVIYTNGQIMNFVITQNCSSSKTFNSPNATPILPDLWLPYSHYRPGLQPIQAFCSFIFPHNINSFCLHFFSIPETTGSINEFLASTFHSLASLSRLHIPPKPQSWRADLSTPTSTPWPVKHYWKNKENRRHNPTVPGKFPPKSLFRTQISIGLGRN